MVKRINSVGKSKDGSRTYAEDIKGNVMFGRTPEITAKLKEGAFANVVEQLQTKTTDADGKLVDLPVEEQRKLNIVTGVWETKEDAIRANAEEELFEVETAAYVTSQKQVIGEKYKSAVSLKDAL